MVHSEFLLKVYGDEMKLIYGKIDNLKQLIEKEGISTDCCVLFTSQRILELHQNIVQLTRFNPFVFQIIDDEKHKNMAQYNECLEFVYKIYSNTGKYPTIINFGGGIVTDIGGFVASSFRRGLTSINVPTTLLGMVDASIGGKVGVNYHNKKNLIGAFYQPKLVITDIDLLKTLPIKEFRNGVAEIIKYGMVCSSNLFNKLNKIPVSKMPKDSLQSLINHCQIIKKQITEEDEKEEGDFRIKLNFGHTVGHAIESASNFKISHGEAISIGMMVETLFSNQVLKYDYSLLQKLNTVLELNNLPIGQETVESKKIIKLLKYDKKNMGANIIKFPAVTKIGNCSLIPIDRNNLADFLIKREL